jgi:hypothetical protein
MLVDISTWYCFWEINDQRWFKFIDVWRIQEWFILLICCSQNEYRIENLCKIFIEFALMKFEFPSLNDSTIRNNINLLIRNGFCDCFNFKIRPVKISFWFVFVLQQYLRIWIQDYSWSKNWLNWKTFWIDSQC